MSSSEIVTRFAPSPTGYLHVGGARTALFNWLLARSTGGRYLLRIEDTDLARSTEDAVRQLVEDLRWLGLHWDNPELVYQSKRLHIYNRIIDDLIARGLAYHAYETPAELDALRENAAKSKRPFLYRRPNYTPEQLARFKDEGRTSVIRFVMPVKEYRFFDVTLGKDVVQPPNECQDFVIRKADGMPTYHFGVVVDDADMKVTHVLRGLEHLKNTFYHIALQEALGYPRPIYAHLSVMLNPENGEKLSKRDRDRRIRKRTLEIMRSSKIPLDQLASQCNLNVDRLKIWLEDDTKQLSLDEQPAVMRTIGLRESDLPEIMVHDFRKNGYAPEVLLNFLALQGWSPGGDREQLPMDEMVKAFSLDRIISSNPRFNREKLKAFSTDFYATASIDRQVSALDDYLLVNDSPLKRATPDQKRAILAMNAGYRVMSEVDEKSRFLLATTDEITFDEKAVEKILRKDNNAGFDTLAKVRDVLKGISEWSAATLEAAIHGFCESSGLGLGKVAQPLRVAVSGSTISPPIYESLAFIGRDATLARINKCLDLLN
jgi:glutamyl-tRNA synthetase